MSTSVRPLVTIAMPTYNRADGYLPEALESALAQTYAPLQILVSDNCSTDGTTELVRSYDDPRIRYVRHETNLGAHGNFDYCVDAAQGDFFLMLHDDDRIDPDFVEVCIDALDRPTGVGYVRTGNRLIDGDGTVVQERPNGAAGTSGVAAVLGWMKFQNYWALSSTLYETDALRGIGGFPTDDFPLTCDCYATARIALREGGGIELAPAKASFRVHSGEITHNVEPLRWIDEWRRLRDAIVSWAPTGEAREALEGQGDVFFSMLCYQFAAKIDSRLSRASTQLSIFARFHRVPPSVRNRLKTWSQPLFAQ